MNATGRELPSVFLKPGELTIAETPTLVSTVLGSCVSLTLFHPGLRIGAICHALLPSGNRPRDFKYVDCSLVHMLGFFDSLHAPRRELRIKLFGGADMFAPPPSDACALSVGRQNVLMATNQLHREGLPLSASDVGGRLGRKILFYTHTGEVLLKRLGKLEQEPGRVVETPQDR